MEKSNKTSPHEIYEVLDQQKKLGELKMNIFAVLSKVNAVIDGLAVRLLTYYLNNKIFINIDNYR